MASYEPTLDIRTPAQDQRRARKRSRKYNSFRDVNAGQVNQSHMLVDGNVHCHNLWPLAPVLPENARIAPMSKRQLWKEAKRLGPQERNIWWNEPEVRSKQRAHRALKRGTTVETAKEECHDEWYVETYPDTDSDEEQQWSWNVMWAGLDIAMENEWGVHGEKYTDMWGLIEKAEDTWDAKRWKAVEREWSKVHEKEVDEERLVVLGGLDVDWGFSDDWEKVDR